MKRIDIKALVKKYQHNIIFFAAGIALVIVLLILFTNSINFLVTSVDTALDVGSAETSPTRFNIEGLRQLDLLDDQNATTTP